MNLLNQRKAHLQSFLTHLHITIGIFSYYGFVAYLLSDL